LLQEGIIKVVNTSPFPIRARDVVCYGIPSLTQSPQANLFKTRVIDFKHRKVLMYISFNQLFDKLKAKQDKRNNPVYTPEQAYRKCLDCIIGTALSGAISNKEFILELSFSKSNFTCQELQLTKMQMHKRLYNQPKSLYWRLRKNKIIFVPNPGQNFFPKILYDNKWWERIDTEILTKIDFVSINSIFDLNMKDRYVQVFIWTTIFYVLLKTLNSPDEIGQLASDTMLTICDFEMKDWNTFFPDTKQPTLNPRTNEPYVPQRMSDFTVTKCFSALKPLVNIKDKDDGTGMKSYVTLSEQSFIDT